MATKTTLKTYFETGDTPTEAQFAALIDAYPSFDDQFASKYVKTEISSEQILALNTTPVELVGAPGAGKVVFPSHLFIEYHYGTVAYATYTILDIGHGALIGGFSVSNLLTKTADYYKHEPDTGVGEVIVNTPLRIWAQNGDPTAGDGTLTVHLWYKELTL